MKKIFLIGALCFFVLTESVGAKSIKLWKSGGNGDGRGLAVRDNDRTICPKGKTKSGSGVCVSCETVLSNCERCSSTTVCTKCKKGYLVKDGKCEKEGCDTDSDCESNQACDTIARKCETLNCPRGKYLSDHKCLSCPAECTECTSATVCTACQTNYELNGTECTQIVCPAGEYVEHSECHPCSEAIASCIECATSKTCTKCDSDMVLIRGNCVEPKCQTDADCREAEYCDGKTKICETVTCDEGYEVREHTCLPNDSETEFECDENTDCEEDEICVDGGTETAACRKLECNDPNQTIKNHECVSEGCTGNEDCEYYQVCDDHKCVTATKCEDLRPTTHYRSTPAYGYAGPNYIGAVGINCYVKQDCTSCNECSQGSMCSDGKCIACSASTQGSGVPYCNCPDGQCWSGSTCSSSACPSGSNVELCPGTTCCVPNGLCGSNLFPQCNSVCDNSGGGNSCTSHTACPSGYECDGDNGCRKCRAGSNLALNNCNCPAGSYSTGYGSCGCVSNDNCKSNQVCQDNVCADLTCAKGKYVNYHQCTTCQPGYYTDSVNLTACKPCPPGSYAAGTGNSSCKTCEKGTYAAGTGNSSCTGCPNGTTTADTGASSASYCLPEDDKCSTNEDCPDKQKCENRTCVDVTCDGACYIAGNHQCVKKSEDCCVTDVDCEPGTCTKTPKAQTGTCRYPNCTFTDAETCKNNTPNCKYCKKDGDGCYTCSLNNETASECNSSQTEYEIYGYKFCCPHGVVAGQTSNWYTRCMQEAQEHETNSCVCHSTSECGYVKVGGWCVWNGNGHQCNARWCADM